MIKQINHTTNNPTQRLSYEWSNNMKQSEAVYQALVNVVGSWDSVCTPTAEQRAQVNAILFSGFRAGTIDLRDMESYDDKGLKSYVSGLQSNWLRKDKRLNGGIKYEAKNPGSRTGMGDASIKAMKALLSTVSDPTGRAEIQGCIDARIAEIAPTKVVTISVDDLPEALRAKYLAGK